MIGLFKRNTISILNENWDVLRASVKFKHIPRAQELIYLKEYDKYFEVINVIYNFERGQGIFIIVREDNREIKI